jgi:hypothetical protein
MDGNVYYVDLPNPAKQRDRDDDSFVNVDTFESRELALAFLFEQYGMPELIADFFVSVGTGFQMPDLDATPENVPFAGGYATA